MTLNASFILFIFIIPEFQLMKEPFTAAVVDYQPIRHKRDTPVAVIEKNVEKYIELIESAQQKGIQIIVFPEAGLTTNEYLNSSILHIYSHRISDDMIDKDLCSLLNSEDDDYILKKLSCAAKASYMYVVLTLIELEGENENEKFFVSTIAFDFCGRLIKKMRKLDLHTNKVLEEMEELNIPFGNFAIIPNIDYLFTMNNATTDKYYILSSLYDSNEKLSEIIKVHSFGANDFNILCSSYLHYDKGYLGSIISSARKSYTKSTDNLIILEIHPEDTPKQSLVQLVNSKNISKYVNDHLLHPNITKDNMNDTKTNITCNVNIVPQDKIEIINYTRISIGDESYKFCGIRQNEEKTGAFDTSTIRSINISLTINNRSIHIPTSIPITYCNTSLPIEQFEYSVGTDKLLLTGNDIRCKTGHLILIGILTRYKNDTNVDNNSSTQKPASGKVPIGLVSGVQHLQQSKYKETFMENVVSFAYIAGIVEYKVDTSETDPNKTIEKNFNEYQTQIEQLKTQSVDIAVFPEYGLTGRVEDPTNYAISVPNAGELLPNNILRTISDAAKTNSMYLVVNLLEYYVNSTNNNVTEYYNTNVVFDKQGALVAKYRKINLFHEPKLTAGTSICTFTATDLGATFGVFTSQDILFSNPSKTISTVNAILFPNAWPVTVPFYNTLSIQHAYVKSKGVTLISANLNDINNGYSGSGIIQSDGSFLISRITGIDGTSIQYKDVSATSRSGTTGTSRALPGEGSLQELENLVYTKSTNFKKYTVKNLDQSTTDVSLSECNNQFCCLLTASLNTDSISQTGVQYKLIVYSGKDTTIINEERSVKYCALVSCENNDESKCGVPNESFSEDFASLSISANFSSTDNPLPVSLNGKFLPLNNFDYSYSIKNSQNTEHRMNIASVTPNLNVIGFVSTEPNGAKGIEFSIMLMLASFILHYVIKM